MQLFLPDGQAGVLLEWFVFRYDDVVQYQRLCKVWIKEKEVIVRAPDKGILQRLHVSAGEDVKEHQPIALLSFASQSSDQDVTPSEDLDEMSQRYDPTPLKKEIDVLGKKQQELQDLIRKTPPDDPAAQSLKIVLGEVTQMLAGEKKKLDDLHALISSRRAQITRLGHRAAAMDIRPYRRLCQDIPEIPILPIKYSPLPSELLQTDPDISVSELSGPDKEERPAHYGNHVYARVISTYPWAARTDMRMGDPICDFFRMKLYENRMVVCVADGCSWGIKPRRAAEAATKAFIEYLEHQKKQMPNAQAIASHILEGFAEGHMAILQDYDDPEEAGQCTLLGGVLAQINRPKSGSSAEEWAFIFGSVGDCKAFLWRKETKEVIDLTYDGDEGRLNVTDSGGRLGPTTVTCKPDLRNLKISYIECHAGDMIVIGSDGFHDNFDAQSLGKLPVDLGWSDSAWEAMDSSDTALLKNLYRCWFLKHRIFTLSQVCPPTPALVVNRVVRHCYQTTLKSREFMEIYEGKKLPENYLDYPGKMDHTTCVCVEVGKLPRPSALKR